MRTEALKDEIFNGICVGGPWHDRGLTWGRDVKVLLASNNDGHAGEYHFNHISRWWVWHGENEGMSNVREQEIEDLLLAKGKTAPRLTPQDIENKIIEVNYVRPDPNWSLIVCVIKLENGYRVTGESACVCMDNFDEAIGRRSAFERARDKIWMLEGYLLRERLNARELARS